jgi:predicted double-glycine peptidase
VFPPQTCGGLFPGDSIMAISFIVRAGFVGAAVLSAAVTHSQPVQGNAPFVQIGNAVPGISSMPVRVKSMRDMRYANMVRQEKDFTCGAAALATILRYVFGRSVTEQEIIRDMLQNTDMKIARERGFSLLDMKKYLERTGLRGRGYRIDGGTLTTLKIPVIALQTTNGYAHFVVVKRVHGGIVFIADPALGHRQLPVEEFIAAWNGIVFAVLGTGLKRENILLESAKSLGAEQRAGIVTKALPPQHEFGLIGMDTF